MIWVAPPAAAWHAQALSGSSPRGVRRNNITSSGAWSSWNCNKHATRLAERRYAACDPDNRLIAAQLEKSWEATLQRVQDCESRVAALDRPNSAPPTPDFTELALDLEGAWNPPGVTMRSRQQLVRTLVTDIIARYDADSHEIVLVIHWRGGQHSELRVRKPPARRCDTPLHGGPVVR
jgi:hypothetical protein